MNSQMNKVASALYADRIAADCCSHVLPHIEPEFRILDVGCGPGSISIGLAKLVPDGSVLGVDINQVSLDAAASAAQEQDVKNIEFRLNDARDLTDLESGSFDVVHSHQVLLHLNNPLKAMQEMHRLVKHGGIVSTRDMAHQIIFPLSPGLSKLAESVDCMYAARGADRFIGRRTHEIAHQAGFEWKNIETSTQGVDIAKDREKFAAAVKYRFRDELIAGAFATVDDCNEHARAWAEWSQKPEARVIGVSGSLLCWK